MRNVFIPLAALALSGTAHAGIISSTSNDGNQNSLECLFNGAGYAAHCSGSGWITSGAPLDPNAEYSTSAGWAIGAATGSVTSIVIEIAGNAAGNTFGLYSLTDPTTRLEVFAGADTSGLDGFGFVQSQRTIQVGAGGNYRVSTDPGTVVTLGSSFGFYLSGPGGTFYSDPTRNPNGDHQVVAFQGDGVRQVDFFGTGVSTWLSNEWILAWEDLAYGGSDKDFNDFVVMIESVHQVPTPGPLALLSVSLIGIAMIRRKRIV
jgi:hypothetical protein